MRLMQEIPIVDNNFPVDRGARVPLLANIARIVAPKCISNVLNDEERMGVMLVVTLCTV